MSRTREPRRGNKGARLLPHVCPGEDPGIQGQQPQSERPLDRRVKPGDDEPRRRQSEEMKATRDDTSSELALRFGAERLCLWFLCGNRTCRRAPSCRGDPRDCMGLLHEWLDAIHEEKRVRGRFAPEDREIETMEEARAYLAWHKTIERTATSEREDLRSADEFRMALVRRLEALNRAADDEHRRKELGAGDGRSTEGSSPLWGEDASKATCGEASG